MKHLKAEDIMVTPVVSTNESSSAKSVATHLLSGLYSGMPVINQELKVVGVISEIDLVEALIEGKDLDNATVDEVMTKGAITADVETPLMEIMTTMRKNNIIRIPITKGGKLVGIIARRDILKSQVAPLQVVVL